MSTSPASIASSPEMQLRRVVLPEPLGPMMPTISPRRTVKLTPRRASTTTSPVSYRFSTARASTMASATTAGTASIRGAGRCLSFNPMVPISSLLGVGRDAVCGRAGRHASVAPRIVGSVNYACCGPWVDSRRDGAGSAPGAACGLVGVGAALFTVAGAYEVPTDPTRVAAQVVTGIGFLGAGVIFTQRGSVRGLTTAASLWLTAAIGLAAGLGAYVALAAARALGP